MTRKRLACFALLCVLLVGSHTAWAGQTGSLANSIAYAIVVGSNPGGAGQKPLAYAEADARRVRDVLVQLGRYDAAHITLLERPGPDQILGALDALRLRLQRHGDRGESATLFFYYSGHARAQAMNLGARSLDLRALREKLASLPTALTIVVLDACQSGAFSHPKGAEPTADFSYSSVNSLNTRGFAVMASSSSAELSQESERLQSSFFTHYLLVALRGAGDRNGDGRVSLDEAYRYAYGQTLAATARTAIGEQHVTLETELVGRGDVPMTYPASSTSQVVLPKNLEGKLLLQNLPERAVLAEVTKAKGQPVRLAVPPARYEAVVRQDGHAYECKMTLGANQSVQLDLSSCSPIADQPVQSKGDKPVGPTEKWGFELPPGTARRFVAMVLQSGDVYFPLSPFEPVECGNRIPWPGAFALTGGTPARVCVTRDPPAGLPSAASDRRVVQALKSAVCREVVPTR